MSRKQWLAWACGAGIAALSFNVGGAAEPWPAFRGRGDSHAVEGKFPWSWESRGSQPGNWSIRLPGYGQSCPVAWGETVFVTSVSGDEKEHLHLTAVALGDGATKWEREFAGTQHVADSDSVSRAAPTPAADTERVYAVFESGDVFALSHAGEAQWSRSFVKDYGEIKGPHGYASSPLLVNDLCILQVAHAGPSYVLALDVKTGETRWKVDHPSQTGWSSPALYTGAGQPQIIVSTSGSVRALDAATGKTLWSTDAVSGNTVASPTIIGDLAIIGSGGDRNARRRPTENPGNAEAAPAPAPAPTSAGSAAVRLNTPTDGAEPRIAWAAKEATTGYASPVVLNGDVYFVNKVGVATCVELATGKVRWQHRLPGEVWATPIANDGCVTFFGKSGYVVTLKPGDEPTVVAESQVSTTDVVYGAAALHNSWIVRTGRGLQRISAPAGDAAN